MDELLTAAKGLAEQELRRANAKFPQFHSLHEGWAVIWEEMEEADEENQSVNVIVEDRMWPHVRWDNHELAREDAEMLAKAALRGAAENIQLAAMAMKMIDYIDRRADD